MDYAEHATSASSSVTSLATAPAPRKAVVRARIFLDQPYVEMQVFTLGCLANISCRSTSTRGLRAPCARSSLPPPNYNQEIIALLRRQVRMLLQQLLERDLPPPQDDDDDAHMTGEEGAAKADPKGPQ